MRTTGSKYEATKDLGVRELAKLIRADLKEAQAAGTVSKDATFSVRISRYSMGQSIDIAAAYPFPIRIADELVQAARDAGHSWPWLRRDVADAKQFCEDLLASYNYDNSDLMSDYFDYKFASNVTEGEVRPKPPKAPRLSVVRHAPQARFNRWAQTSFLAWAGC